MRTLARAVRRGLQTGEPLPSPWPVFEEKKAIWRKGGFHLVTGPPGSMKTIACLNLVHQFGQDVGTLYFSSDSDDNTMASRVLAMVLGKTTDEMEAWLKSHPGAASKALLAYGHVRWCFHPSPTIEDIYLELDAYAEIEGIYPDHTIVDIAMDVDFPGTSDQNYWGLFAEFKILARECVTALTVAHHTSEAVKGEPCQPRSAILGKASQYPTLIFTIAPSQNGDKLNFSVVKNRFGPSDATGRKFFTLAVDPARCRITEDTGIVEVPVVYRGPWTRENV